MFATLVFLMPTIKEVPDGQVPPGISLFQCEISTMCLTAYSLLTLCFV